MPGVVHTEKCSQVFIIEGKENLSQTKNKIIPL